MGADRGAAAREIGSGQRAVVDRPLRPPAAAEVELLWAAASPIPDLQRVAEAAALSDVGFVLEAAIRHRVAGLVIRSLEAAGVDLGAEAADARSEAAGWRAHAHLALPKAAATTLRPLAEAGLEPLVFKGMALAERYPVAGLRPMVDIDLLVPPDQLELAIGVLEHAGWARGRHPAGDFGYEVAFRHPEVPGVPLELHYDFTERRERPPTLSGTELWAARERATVLGHPGWILPPELEIVVLVAHAAKVFHLFDRLLWMIDLAVVSQATTLDWDKVERIAIRSRRRVATAVGLGLAARLGAEVPEALTRIPPALGRRGTFEAIMDPQRPFTGATKADAWLPYAFIDDLRGMARMAVADLREPPWGKRRTQVVVQLSRIVADGTRRRFRRPRR